MNIKRKVTLGLLILLLIVIAIIFILGTKEMITKKSATDLSEIIEQGNIDKLNLTIYYMDPSILTLIAISIDDLIVDKDTVKVVISGSELEDYIELITQMSNTALVPVEHMTGLNTRLYYLFEYENEGKIFDVATGGVKIDKEGNYVGECLFVNGLAVELDGVFFDIVMPFLPDEIVKYWELYLSKRI